MCLYLHLSLVASSFFGYIGKPAEMGLAILAGATALAFANLGKICRFKGVGFEGEMRRDFKGHPLKFNFQIFPGETFQASKKKKSVNSANTHKTLVLEGWDKLEAE
jgi:hypothetical protein